MAAIQVKHAQNEQLQKNKTKNRKTELDSGENVN